MLSCSGYPACRVAMWMPSTVESLTVSPRQCETCRGRPRLLEFVFKTAAYAPYYPRRHTACVAGCDREFMETVGLRPLSATGAGEGLGGGGICSSVRLSVGSSLRPSFYGDHLHSADE